jgi:hypothetical protein
LSKPHPKCIRESTARAFWLIGAILLSFNLVSCGVEDDDSDPATAPIPEEEEELKEAEGQVVSNGVLYVGISQAPENDDFQTSGELLELCEIPPGSAEGTTIACNLAIPEGQLYFSDHFFTVGTSDPTACPLLFFQPYFYQAFDSAAATPFWTTSEVDCSVGPGEISADCFNGPAKTIVPDFPRYTRLYMRTVKNSKETYKAMSPNSAFAGSNRYMVNNKADKTAAVASINGGDGYIANSMRDWTVTCMDDFLEEEYTINITISDRDTEGTADIPDNFGLNDQLDWDSTAE